MRIITILMLSLLCSIVTSSELIKDVDKFIVDNKGDWNKWKKHWDDKIKDLESTNYFLGEETYACDYLKNWLVDLNYDSELQKDKKLELAYWYKLYTVKKWKIPETISQSIVEQFIRKTLGIKEKEEDKEKKEVKEKKKEEVTIDNKFIAKKEDKEKVVETKK